MGEPSPAIQIDSLTYAYGARVALANLSLKIPPGTIHGFLGPNGSGKTTLFRILCTLIPPQQGRVSILGMDVTEQRNAVRQQLGVVFQSPSLDKQLTAEENLLHHGHLYGLRGAELKSRIGEMLDRVGLTDRPRERVGQFSGGMRRRVELAKGLLNRPRVLLLDEPSTGLDPGARIDLWRYLRDIRDRDGVTILLTTHLMEEADHCDRLSILNSGTLAADDSPAALKERIGGDVVHLTSSNAEKVLIGLQDRFGIAAVREDHSLRFERPRAHELIPQLIEAFPGLIDSVSVGKPTLEDVFVHLTGKTWQTHS